MCVLEKGRNHLLSLEPPFAGLGRLSNDEIKFDRRHFLGPDPLLEPRTFRRSAAEGDRLFVGDVNNMPSTVGGAGYHADGKLPRLREVDFRLRSELGPVPDAHVADWPMDYDEMEPFYAEAERLIGVAGDHTGNPFAAWRSGPYPMPPGVDMFLATMTAPAAARLGFHPYRAPTGANSVPYDGRPACNNCGFCAFYGCPIEAKGDPIASLRRALQTGRCEIRPESVAVEVLLDATGKRSRGVRYLDADAIEREVSAAAIVVACGAFETPRLLLRSGIGNSSDLVGRYLMFHIQTIVLGYFPFRLHAYKGRDVTHLMDDPIVGDAAVADAARSADLPYLRGGIVEHGGSGHPITEALHTPPGRAHSRRMAASDGRDKMAVFTMQGEDLPQPTNRVDLDPHVHDVWGLPAGRVTYRSHRHDMACARHWAPRLEAVMREAGAEATAWVTAPGMPDSMAPDLPPISRHWMGTARMGSDPATSVCDPSQRLWDVQNVIVADSSVFPTASGYGPTLTIVALAIPRRVRTRLKFGWRLSSSQRRGRLRAPSIAGGSMGDGVGTDGVRAVDVASGASRAPWPTRYLLIGLLVIVGCGYGIVRVVDALDAAPNCGPYGYGGYEQPPGGYGSYGNPDCPPPNRGDATLVVEPATGLVDRQTVTVRGSNFDPDTQFGTAQCDARLIPGSASTDVCDLSTVAIGRTGPDGAATVSMAVRRIIFVRGVEIDCAVEGACVVGGATIPDGFTPLEAAVAPISFDPSVPPVARLDVAITVDKVTRYEVTGTVVCNRDSEFFANVFVSQTVGRHEATASGYGDGVPCSPTPATWTATLFQTSGRLSARPVDYDVFGYAYDGFETATAEVSGTTQLSPGGPPRVEPDTRPGTTLTVSVQGASGTGDGAGDRPGRHVRPNGDRGVRMDRGFTVGRSEPHPGLRQRRVRTLQRRDAGVGADHPVLRRPRLGPGSGRCICICRRRRPVRAVLRHGVGGGRRTPPRAQ